MSSATEIPIYTQKSSSSSTDLAPSTHKDQGLTEAEAKKKAINDALWKKNMLTAEMAQQWIDALELKFDGLSESKIKDIIFMSLDNLMISLRESTVSVVRGNNSQIDDVIISVLVLINYVNQAFEKLGVHDKYPDYLSGYVELKSTNINLDESKCLFDIKKLCSEPINIINSTQTIIDSLKNHHNNNINNNNDKYSYYGDVVEDWQRALNEYSETMEYIKNLYISKNLPDYFNDGLYKFAMDILEISCGVIDIEDPGLDSVKQSMVCSGYVIYKYFELSGNGDKYRNCHATILSEFAQDPSKCLFTLTSPEKLCLEIQTYCKHINIIIQYLNGTKYKSTENILERVFWEFKIVLAKHEKLSKAKSDEDLGDKSSDKSSDKLGDIAPPGGISSANSQ